MLPQQNQKAAILIDQGVPNTFSPNSSPSRVVPLPHDLGPRVGHEHSEAPTDKRQRWIRFVIFIFCLTFLVLGRSTIPDHDVPCIVDKLMNAMSGINVYVIVQHPTLRTAMLIGCSLCMDLMFLSTGAYWIFYGKTCRIIVSTLIFYFIRAAVQQMWYSPYPPGYFWDDPGFPSFVVPYGRSTDFFFSGHIGFVVINASEWVKNQKPWPATIVGIIGVYTAFILLVYQAHYSIDIFTGIVCASWVFLIVDMYKDKFDGFFIMIYLLIKDLIDLIFNRTTTNESQSRLLSPTQEKDQIQVKIH